MALHPVQSLMRAAIRLRGFREGEVVLPPGHVVPSMTHLDSGPVHVDDPGDAPHPVVFLHGLGSSTVTWAPVLPRVATEVRVLAPDLPGYGRTPLPAGRPYATLREKVDAVIGYLERMEHGERFSLVGQSMGGWIAASVAAEAPQLVGRLTLVNCAGVFTPQVFEQRRLFSPVDVAETRELWTRMWHTLPASFPLFARTYRESTRLPAVRGFLEHIGEDDFLNDRLAKIAAPTLLVWGLSDRLIDYDSVRVFRDQVPDLRYRPIPSCGHVPQREAPDRFLSYLMPWLRGIEPPEPDRPGIAAAERAAADAAERAVSEYDRLAREAAALGIDGERLERTARRYGVGPDPVSPR